MDIFISYARKDRARVNKIAKALEAEGYTVWWDRHIRAGQKFQQEINKAIKSTKAVVVVWSKHSIDSHWVQDEAQHGVQNNALVPVMIDDVSSPLGFGQIHSSFLQDGGDDPTTSEEWDDFLEAVRGVVGEGEGQPSPNDPLAQLLSRPVQESKAAAASSKKSAPAKKKAGKATPAAPSWKRYAPIAAMVAAVLLVGAVAIGYFSRPSAPPDPQNMEPVVLGIYPSDAQFGKDQKRGLDTAFGDMPGVTLRDLVAPLDAMKGRDAPELIERLENYLANNNVVAIVGPSITEFTPEVLDVVEASGRKPAIVLTTASTRANIGWEDRDLPLFRIGSGIDERAAQFARLARNRINGGSELVLLFEEDPTTNEKTYGQIFFQRIAGELEEWKRWSDEGKIRSIRYTRGEIVDSFEAPQRRALLDQNKMIIVVGLSTDFDDLVREFYGAEDTPRAALLGGWNTSKSIFEIIFGKVNEETGEVTPPMAIQHGRLFDMTDVYLSPPDSSGLADLRRFEDEFGPLSPALRQQAVAFDSGLVVKKAIEQIGDGEIRAENVVDILRGRTFEGVTGQVAFAKRGDNVGQNEGPSGGLNRTLYNLQFNPDNAEYWSEIRRFDVLLAPEVASTR